MKNTLELRMDVVDDFKNVKLEDKNVVINIWYFFYKDKFHIAEYLKSKKKEKWEKDFFQKEAHLEFTSQELTFLKKTLRDWIKFDISKNWDKEFSTKIGNLHIYNMNGEFTIERNYMTDSGHHIFFNQFSSLTRKKDVLVLARYLKI